MSVTKAPDPTLELEYRKLPDGTTFSGEITAEVKDLLDPLYQVLVEPSSPLLSQWNPTNVYTVTHTTYKTSPQAAYQPPQKTVVDMTTIEGNPLHIAILLRQCMAAQSPAKALAGRAKALYLKLGEAVQELKTNRQATNGKASIIHNPGVLHDMSNTKGPPLRDRKDVSNCVWPNLTPFELSWALHMPRFALDANPPAQGMDFKLTKELLLTLHKKQGYIPLGYLYHSDNEADLKEALPNNSHYILNKLLVTYAKEYLQAKIKEARHIAR